MRLNGKLAILAAMAGLTMIAAAAHAEGTGNEAGILAGIGLNSPSYGLPSGFTSPSISSAVGFVGGGYYSLNVAPMFNVELEALYDRRSFTIASQGVGHTVVDIPVMARYMALPPFLNVGFGPYVGFGVGDVTVGGVNESRSAYGINGTEFGLIGSLQGRYAIAPNMNVLLDVRYLLGLTNQLSNAAPDTTIKEHDLQFLAGVGVSL